MSGSPIRASTYRLVVGPGAGVCGLYSSTQDSGVVSPAKEDEDLRTNESKVHGRVGSASGLWTKQEVANEVFVGAFDLRLAANLRFDGIDIEPVPAIEFPMTWFAVVGAANAR